MREISPISFTIPYHTVVTQYPVRGHDHAVNYEPQHKAVFSTAMILRNTGADGGDA